MKINAIQSTTNLHEFFNKYSDLISCITILVNDILFLLGEALSNFPKVIGNSAFVFLNIAGFLSINFQMDLLKKTIHDMKFSYKMNNNKIFLITILKIFFIVSSLILLNLSFAASFFKFFQLTNKMLFIYRISKPYSTFCILSSILLDIFHYYINKKIITKTFKEDQIAKISQIYISNTPLNNKDLNKLSAEIRESMDKDTLKAYLNALFKTSSVKMQKKIFMNVALKNIKTQSIIESSSLALKAIGYLAMFLCAWFPSTTIHATICTMMSTLYTTQLIYQKYSQRNQQKKADIIYTT